MGSVSVIFIYFLVYFAANAFAQRQVSASSTAQILAAISNAQAGDVITIEPGTYTMTGVKNTILNKNGRADARIVVRAAQPRTVTIRWVGVSGNYVEGFVVTHSAYWTFENLIFESDCSALTSDNYCEHLLHVVGSSDYFHLRTCVLRNANAQIKVNGNDYPGRPAGAPYRFPNYGIVEWNEFYDTAGRRATNPVTKINSDGGHDWIVRGNFIHDFHKLEPDYVRGFSFFFECCTN